MTEITKRADTCEFTAQDYREMRKVDADVAYRMGWALCFQDREVIWVTPPGEPSSHLQYPPEMAAAEAWIDKDDEGLPFYSYTMNGAMRVLHEVLKNWGHAQQNYFWDALQQQASFDTDSADASPSLVPYPSVLSSLIDDLPAAICRAYIKAYDRLQDEGENTNGPTRRAAQFRSTHIIQEGDVPGQSPRPISAPWVHRSEDDTSDGDGGSSPGTGSGDCPPSFAAVEADRENGSPSSPAPADKSGEGCAVVGWSGGSGQADGNIQLQDPAIAEWEAACATAIKRGKVNDSLPIKNTER